MRVGLRLRGLAFGLVAIFGNVFLMRGQRRNQRGIIARFHLARETDRLGRSGRTRRTEARQLTLAFQELVRARRGVTELDRVPVCQLLLVGARFELGFQRQLLALHVHD